MKITSFLFDDKALGNTVGVVLLVGITLVLGTIALAFMTGYVGQVEEYQPPNTAVDFEYDSTTGELVIEKGSGDIITPGNTGKLTITGSGTTGVSPSNWGAKINSPPGDPTSGIVEENIGISEIIWEGNINSGETIQMQWVSESGGQSEVLGEFTAP